MARLTVRYYSIGFPANTGYLFPMEGGRYPKPYPGLGYGFTLPGNIPAVPEAIKGNQKNQGPLTWKMPKTLDFIGMSSGQQDLNLRPLGPQIHTQRPLF